MRPSQWIEHLNHVTGVERTMHVRRYHSKSILLDNLQYLNSSNIIQMISHKVRTPSVVAASCLERFVICNDWFSSSLFFCCKLRLFKTYMFEMYVPTFALQQNVQASTFPTRSHRGDLSHTHDGRVLWIANPFIVHHRRITAQRRIRSPLRNLPHRVHLT